MGKTYHNYLGKNHIHDNARPYERTREHIVDDTHTTNMEEVSFFWNDQKEELEEEK